MQYVAFMQNMTMSFKVPIYVEEKITLTLFKSSRKKTFKKVKLLLMTELA